MSKNSTNNSTSSSSPFSDEVPELLQKHLDHLKASAISTDVIRERGYESILGKKRLADLGFSKAQQRVPGILIPLWGVDGKPVGYQFKPDTPRQDGKGKLVRYENPAGSSVRLDCPPRCQKMLGDPSVDLWITEGSKKADSLASRGACAISLTGVWGFKGKNDLGGTTLLADWDYIALRDRTAYLAFDSDIIGKPQVRQALQRLSQHLTNKQSKLLVIHLPNGSNGKVGVDDYLADRHTLDDMKALVKPYQPDIEEETIRRPYLYSEDRLYLQIRRFDGQMTFAYLNKGQVRFTAQVSVGNGRSVAPQPLPKGADGVEVPIVGMPDENISASPLLSAGELFNRIKKHIAIYVDLAPLDLELCCYYILFTWFYQKVNTLGYLRFIGDTGKGKSRIQKVVGNLCFYPLITSGASSFSGMARTSQYWRGTMVMDEADLSGDMAHQITKFLNLGIERGQYYVLSDKQNPRFQQYFDPFMPKVLAMRQPFEDNATEGRLLSIATYETSNQDIPIILPLREYLAQVQALRNYITRFVLEHWNGVDGSKMVSFNDLAIEPRLKQLAMPLSIVFQVWPEGIQQFKNYLLARQKDLRRERSMAWEGSLFNLVYSIASGDLDLSSAFSEYYSDSKPLAVTPTMVAKQMHSSPKAVTHALAGIGFTVESRRLPGGKKKPRLYAVPDARKWREIVSRYYYTEEDDPPAEAPDVLRSSKYVVCPQPSQVSQVSHKSANPSILKKTGTDGTDGTLISTRNNGDKSNVTKTETTPPADDSTPDYPTHPCHNCGCGDYWLTDWNEWLCSKCHPKPVGGQEKC